MVPVVLVKHRKDEVFLVRFLSDNNELSVDLGQIRFRFTDGLSEAAAQALTGDGNGGVKRGRKKKEEASEIVQVTKQRVLHSYHTLPTLELDS